MIECYYSSCQWHYKDEPFCNQNTCTASEEDLKAFEEERQAYLASKGLSPEQFLVG